MSSPQPPKVLANPGEPLYRKLLSYLATDTDPDYGLLAGLAARAGDDGNPSPQNSLYPNFTTRGPTADRSVCPTPFVVVYGGITRMGRDGIGREFRLVVEIHDDRDHGDERWPGLTERVKLWLLGGLDAGGTKLRPWVPENDRRAVYQTAPRLEEETAQPIYDDRFDSYATQLQFCVVGMDRSSARGLQG